MYPNFIFIITLTIIFGYLTFRWYIKPVKNGEPTNVNIGQQPPLITEYTDENGKKFLMEEVPPGSGNFVPYIPGPDMELYTHNHSDSNYIN